MTDTPRDPHSDNDLIDQAEDLPTPSQAGTSGGDLHREIGARDEGKGALGGEPQPTSVHKGDKANDGDSPTLPNRDGAAARTAPSPSGADRFVAAAFRYSCKTAVVDHGPPHQAEPQLNGRKPLPFQGV